MTMHDVPNGSNPRGFADLDALLAEMERIEASLIERTLANAPGQVILRLARDGFDVTLD